MVIQVTASTVCSILSMVVIVAMAVVAWAVSSDERTERVVRWIERWSNRRDQ